MNADIKRPRAKAKQKALVRTAQAITAELISTLNRGVDKIGLAYDAAEPGEPVEVLLDHVSDILGDAIRPIWNEPLTKADTDAAYSAMFVPLAALKGAIALSRNTAIEHVLVEAHAVLDAAQTSIDSCAGLSNLLPDGAAREEADFVRGRDIAINMLSEGQGLFGEKECYRENRNPGTAQDNFVDGHLQDIFEEPALRAGFTSVLSHLIGSGETIDPEFFKRLTLAQTQGENTTVCTGLPTARASVPRDDPLDEALNVICQARDVSEKVADDGGTDVLRGVHRLLEGAVDKVTAAHAGRTKALNDEACDELAGVLGVLLALDLDELLLYAVETLVVLAKAHVDAASVVLST